MTYKNPNKLFPLFVTERMDETRRFYKETAGFSVVHDMPEYFQVRYGAEDGPELCFMRPDAFPDGTVQPSFRGEGVIVSIPTASADEKYSALKKKKAELVSEPADKPWGWRSFFARDPNGVLLDFFHVYKEMPAATAS